MGRRRDRARSEALVCWNASWMPSEGFYRLLKHVAALGVRAKHVEARARWREKHGVTRLRERGGARDRVVHRVGTSQLERREPSRALDMLRPECSAGPECSPRPLTCCSGSFVTGGKLRPARPPVPGEPRLLPPPPPPAAPLLAVVARCAAYDPGRAASEAPPPAWSPPDDGSSLAPSSSRAGGASLGAAAGGGPAPEPSFRSTHRRDTC